MRTRFTQFTAGFVALIVLFCYALSPKRSTKTSSIPNNQQSSHLGVGYEKLPIETLDAHWVAFRSRNPPTAIHQLESTQNTTRPLSVAEQYATPSDWQPTISEPFDREAYTPHDNSTTSADLSGLFYKHIPNIQAKFSADTNQKETEYRQGVVKNAFLHAWNSYKANAYGFDEVHPISGKPFNISPKKFSKSPFNGWGATIVDNLDTLLIMGLLDEYHEARNRKSRSILTFTT